MNYEKECYSVDCQSSGGHYIHSVPVPAGCLKEEVPYLTLSAEGEIGMAYDGGTVSVEVKTNQDWAAVSDAAWCVISGGEGSYKGEFVITVEPNDGTADRKAEITVSGGLCSNRVRRSVQCRDYNSTDSSGSGFFCLGK